MQPSRSPTPRNAPQNIVATAPRWLLPTLVGYSWARCKSDALAALVLSAMLVPVGMSYAEASGVPAIYGLYATLVPLLIYALVGTSRILILGPDSALAALIAISTLPLAAGSSTHAVALAGMLSIITGLLCILAGLLRLGFVTDLLSTPIRYGYLNGIALTVLVSQLPKLFGLNLSADSLLQQLPLLAQALWHLPWLTWPSLLGLGCLVLIIICQKYLPRWPAVLLAMIVSTIVVQIFDLSGVVAVIGQIPQGLPNLTWPQVSWAEVQHLIPSALAIALVAFADMSILTRSYAQRLGTRVYPNRELLALGCANLGSGVFQGFTVSSSASRTPVAEAAGAKTQMTGVFSALCILLFLLFAPNLLSHVPKAALAAVVIAACWSLIEYRAVKSLYRLRRSEFWTSMFCFFGVAVLGVVEGIFWAVAIALGLFVWRAWQPYSAVLGRVDGLKGYHDIQRHPEAKQIEGLLLFRWDAPLFFANQGQFRRTLQRHIAQAKRPIRCVVLAAEPITDVDTTAAEMLGELEQWLKERGILLYFAEMKGNSKDWLRRYALFQDQPQRFFPTIGRAVDQYVQDFAVDWVDWEDQGLAQPPTPST